jgi:hypothetical protein
MVSPPQKIFTIPICHPPRNLAKTSWALLPLDFHTMCIYDSKLSIKNCLSVSLLFCSSALLSIYLFVYLSICLTVFLPFCLTALLSYCLSFFLLFCLSFLLSIYPTVFLPFCLSVSLPFCLSAFFPSICLFVFLSFFISMPSNQCEKRLKHY